MLAVMLAQALAILVAIAAIIIAVVKNVAGGNSGKIKIAATKTIAADVTIAVADAMVAATKSI